MKSAERWTAELKSWKESLPAFLEPEKVDPSILVPIFQRQSTVLRLAYAHALILANRPSLLNNFGDLSRRQDLPLGEPDGSLKECIDAAVLVVDIVNGFIEEGKMCKGFWFTHYISFCAIATLYVFTIQQSLPQRNRHNTADCNVLSLGSMRQGMHPTLNTQHFEAAEKCQRRIEETTAKTSPFRRYTIILDELRREVLQRLEGTSINQAIASHVTMNRQRMMPEIRLPHTSIGSGEARARLPSASRTCLLDFGATTDVSHLRGNDPLPPQGYTSVNMGFDSNPSPITPEGMFNGFIMDPGEMMGWSEFDSCVSYQLVIQELWLTFSGINRQSLGDSGRSTTGLEYKIVFCSWSATWPSTRQRTME